MSFFAKPADNTVLPPGAVIELRLGYNPPESEDLVASVQYFADGVALGAPLTQRPFRLENANLEPGEHNLSALVTDKIGRSSSALGSRITVTTSGAGLLALHTSVSATQIAPGAFISYRLTATNTGSKKMRVAKVQVPVPEHTRFVSASFLDLSGNPAPPTGKNPAVAQRSITWMLKNLQPGASTTMLLVVQLEYDRPLGASLLNTAFNATAPGAGGKAITGHFPEVPIEVSGPAPESRPMLALVKTIVDRPETANDSVEMVEDLERGLIYGVKPGGIITIALAVHNSGTEMAADVVIKDEIPAGTVPVSRKERLNGLPVKAGGVKIERSGATGKRILFNAGDLAPGATITASYQVRVLAQKARGQGVGGIIESLGANVSSASLSATPHSFPEQIDFKVLGVVSFSQPEQTSTPAQARVGEEITYYVRYINVGGRAATNVQVIDTIPEGTVVKAASYLPFPRAGGTATQPDARTVLFNAGTLQPGEDLLVGVVVEVTDAARIPGQPILENAARIYADTYFPPPAPGARQAAKAPERDDVITFTTDLNRLLDPAVARLFIKKRAPLALVEGGEFRVGIVVGNLSDNPASGVFVTDTIPDGARLVSTSGALKSGDPIGTQLDATGKKVVAILSELPPHSARAITITYSSIVGPGAGSVGTSKSAGSTLVSPDCTVAAPRTREIHAGPATTYLFSSRPESLFDPSTTAGSYLQTARGGSPALIDPQFTNKIRQFTSGATLTTIGGADLIQMHNGAILIPLGGNQILASGALSLISNGGLLIAQEGALIDVTAAGAEISFQNLIGNDGGSLANQTAGGILTALVAPGGGNRVAGGGGRLINAGGGNLVDFKGVNLIANDGGTFRELAALIGNDVGTLIGNDVGTLIGNDVGTLVGIGGSSNVVSHNGGSLISPDRSSALFFTREGVLSLRGGNVISDKTSGFAPNTGGL